MAKRQGTEQLQRALKFFEASLPAHEELMRKVDNRSDVYHAVYAEQADVKQWESDLYAKYAMHIVDTTLASMVEDKLRYKIRPRKTLEDMFDPTAEERLRQGAEAHQILMDWQMRQSKHTRIQRPFLLQNAIAGITVAKTLWVERVERRRRMVSVDEPLLNEQGDQIIHPAHGPMTYPNLVERVEHLPVYDGPMTEVIDIHDFGWAENARTIAGSRYLWHRTWVSYDELEQEFQEDGMYGPSNGGWTWEQVKRDLGASKELTGQAANVSARWGSNKDTSFSKDKLEVIECWDTFEKDVITFVNRKALLAYKSEFPFFHERAPFTVCTTQADLFEIVGISQIEKVAALQEMLHEVQNQSLDNLKLINNAITIYRPDIEDPDALEFSPRAMWGLESPDMVQLWTPNPMPAEISLNREGLLKGDMQNVAATFPFSSGAESQTVDQTTATGASIVSGLAQRSIDLAKQPVYDAWEDIGNDWLVLNNQFITEPVAATVLGLEGEEQTKVIFPEVLSGDYHYEQEAIPDALMQQQETAKWQAVLQTVLQGAAIMVPLAAQGVMQMPDIQAVIEEYLKSMGVEDTKRFFKAAPPPPQAAPPQQGGQPPAGEAAPMGITGPASIDPAVSPGAQISQSPEQNLQRATALGMGGGGQNA